MDISQRHQQRFVQRCGARVMLVLLATLTSGCASWRADGKRPTPAGYDQRLSFWVGADANSLVNEWGSPDRTFNKPNGNVIWIYDKVLGEDGEGTTRSVQTRFGTVGFSSSRSVRLQCKTEFEIAPSGKAARYAVVVNYRFEGNRCVDHEL